EVPVAQEQFPADAWLAIAAPADVRRLGLTVREASHPLDGSPVALVDAPGRRVAEAAGIRVWNAAGVITLQLGAALRRRSAAFVGFQEVSELVERLER